MIRDNRSGFDDQVTIILEFEFTSPNTQAVVVDGGQ